MTHVDLLVIGAGPAGSALAATMSHAGASVLLVETARHPRPKACAEYASPRIAEELGRIGLGAAVWRETAVPLHGMHLHAGGRSTAIRYADRRGPRSAWGVNREMFDAALAAHATRCGAALRERTSAVRLEVSRGRVHGVRTRRRGTDREELVTADWTVGADGVRSTVARLVGAERPVRFPRRLGLVAHYSGVEGLTGHGEMHVGAEGYIGLAPMPHGDLSVGMALPLDGASGSSQARFEQAIASIPAVALRLAGARRISPIRGAAPIGHRVSRAAGPGWMLIGDAAGFVDPFTGEGIHRALRSARAAADALLAGGDVERTYMRERRRAFAAKSALTWLVQGFLLAPPLLAHALDRLEARPDAALRLGSALGDLRPATDALAPSALFEVLAP
ncbi:MAG: NAD(P)/FAD-dependent oxidoreductase [Chloroflexi bacterium]|nr:NAD(P)/FAD-dependent oxidoreductase [Chloroflexota bacterium]